MPAPAAAAKAAKLLAMAAAQAGVKKPEDVIAVILLVLFLPVALLSIFFILPAVAFFSDPGLRPSQVEYYAQAAEKANRHGMTVAWEELLAIDTVLLEQNFGDASAKRSLGMLWSYLQVNYSKYHLIWVRVPDGQGGFAYVQVWERARSGALNTREEIVRFISAEMGLLVVTVPAALEALAENNGKDRGGVKFIFHINTRPFEEVLAIKNLNQEQKEWAQHLFDQGLTILRARRVEMPPGWRPEPTGPFVWPTPGSYTIIAVFGPKVCPEEPFDGDHPGVDIKTAPGAAVIAAKEGIVVRAERGTVKIRSLGGYETRYIGLDTIAVSRGQEVRQGDRIGNSKGRLQFEIRRFTRARDPLEYF